MGRYLLAYYGEPKFNRPKEGSEHMARWRAWMGGLGDAVVDPGLPVMRGKTVSSRGVTEGRGSDRLAGFTVVKADSLDAAVAMTRGCPHLDHGTIDVHEVMDMPMK
jgi:hypothetical protein